MNTGRIERLLRLIQTLQSGGARSADDLATAVGISRRTFFRDIAVLERAGVPVRYDHAIHRYSFEQSALLPPVTFSHSEALAMLLLTRHSFNHPCFSELDSASSAALKLEAMLPAAIRDHLEPFLNDVDFRFPVLSAGATLRSTLPVLQSAMSRHKKVQVEYDSLYDEKVIDVTLHPYRLACIHRGWYLIAYTEQFDEVRTYKMQRVLSLKLLADVFEPDPTFSLDDYFGNAWMMIKDEPRVHVKIKFSSKVAANVAEVIWHQTQSTTLGLDGTLIFEADVDGVREIVWWVLGYGDQALVLEPKELIALLAEHANRMYVQYCGQAARHRQRNPH